MAQLSEGSLADVQQDLLDSAQMGVQGYICEALHEPAHPPSQPDYADQAPLDLGGKGLAARFHRISDTFKNTVHAVKDHLSSGSSGSGKEASKESHRQLVDHLFDRVCGLSASGPQASAADTAALFIWSVLARQDDTLHHMWTNEKDLHMEQTLLSLSPDQLAAVRDAVDVISEGLGFLPLVLSTGKKKFLEGLIKILQQETPPRYLPLKIFSDIDDTYLAGWLDTPIGDVYDGVRELYRDLLQGHSPPEVIDRQVQLIFLSARPHSQQQQSITDLGKKGAGFPTPGRFVMLYGKLVPDVVAAVDTYAMGMEKVKMFRLYRALYPHFLYFFFGDTGQGDAETGEAMFKLPPADQPVAVFLHEVRPSNQVHTHKIGDRFIYHDNYAEARAKAIQRGYLTETKPVAKPDKAS